VSSSFEKSPHVPYETLWRYLDSSIETDERENVDLHLAECEFCRRDLKDAQKWRAELAATPLRSPTRTKRLVFLGVLLVALLTALAALAWIASR
jgi:hypothetical protein